MFNLPVRKSEINVVLSAVLASMLLLSISSLPYTISKPIAITNYANAQTSSTVENASGIELSDTTINATTNGSMTQMTNQDNRSSNTQNKTELKDVAPFVFEDSNQQTNQSNVTGASVAGSDSAVTGSSEVTADFNGDGFEDKAIGVPYEDVDSADGTIIDAGIVHVIYGSAGGLSTSAVLSDQLITQDSLDFIIPMRSEIGDQFGSGITSGDFNGDGKADLAIGITGEDYQLGFYPVNNGGLLYVMYGASTGLSGDPNIEDQVWIEGWNIQGPGQNNTYTGYSVSGDFNGDGNDDLAIGVPLRDIEGGPNAGKIGNAGQVHIIYGSSQGLSADLVLHDQVLRQGFENVDETPEAADNFGSSLSSGDFNGDGKDDLAIGVPDEALHSSIFCEEGVSGSCQGTVHVVYGSTGGLSATAVLADQLWTQDSPNIQDGAEDFDKFGFSLASGDYNGDRKDDLAIGVPGESIAGETIKNVGKVHVIYGSLSGLSATSPVANQLWQQGVNGLDEVAETGDYFGFILSSGNFNGDKINGQDIDDLVVGVPHERISGETLRVGKVQVIYGSSSGLSTTSTIADQLWQQGVNGLDDVAEDDDWFGLGVSAGDYNGDGKDDLSIDVPFESIASETIRYVGKMHTIYGSSSGLSTTSTIADQLWQQGVNGLDDVAEAEDLF